MTGKLRTFLMLGAVAALAGCGAVRPVHYYDLDLPVATGALQAEVYPVTLLVGRIGAAHLFRDDRLVYREGDNQMGTYEYHRWSEPPVDMVEEMLVSALRGSGQYRGVERQASNTRGDLIVRGELLALEEVDTPALAARVALELELFDPKTGTTVWNQTYSHDEAVASKEVPAVVAALNRNLNACVSELTRGIAQYVASHTRATSQR